MLIPTHGRPHLIARAVRSALAQSAPPHEVIVVLDGPDRETAHAVARVGVETPLIPLRLVTLPTRSGLGAALNAGAAAATGAWLALLDDDDEWMAEKLAAQIALVTESVALGTIVSCRFVARAPMGDRVWPLRTPEPRESVIEYLYCQRRWRGGEGMLLPSTLLFQRRLWEAVPFTPGLPRFNDVDWLLRVHHHCSVDARFPVDPRPLAVWYREAATPTMSERGAWRDGAAFARTRRALLTGRAYASFLLTHVAMMAARDGDWRAVPALLREAFVSGSVRWPDLAAFASIWGLSPTLRARLTSTPNSVSSHDTSAATARPRAPQTTTRKLAHLATTLPSALWGAWRERERLATVDTVCLFIGYPRSGHSLIGALLDAHPEAAIAHELDALRYVFARFPAPALRYLMWARSQRDAEGGREWAGYSYRVPGQWQGRATRLRVVGDKHGEATTLRLHWTPTLVQRSQAVLGPRVRFVHVVRNPFDVIATMALRGTHRLTPGLVPFSGHALRDAAAYFFALCESVDAVRPALHGAMVDVHYDTFVARPREELTRLCHFVGITPSDDYLTACASIVFATPNQSRTRVSWTPDLIEDIRRRSEQWAWLRGYAFDA